MLRNLHDLSGYKVSINVMPDSSFIITMSDLLQFLELHIKKEQVNFANYEGHIHQLLGRKRLVAIFLQIFLNKVAVLKD